MNNLILDFDFIYWRNGLVEEVASCQWNIRPLVPNKVFVTVKRARINWLLLRKCLLLLRIVHLLLLWIIPLLLWIIHLLRIVFLNNYHLFPTTCELASWGASSDATWVCASKPHTYIRPFTHQNSLLYS